MNNYNKSYSQSGEDLIVKFIFDSLNIEHPSYIDVGAYHPYNLNNTAIFYESGSRGINIEPNPALIGEFNTHRQHDINLNIGIGPLKGTKEFYIMSIPTLSIFDKNEADNYIKNFKAEIKYIINIGIENINNIIAKYFHVFPDFLSLDAEGMELEILQTIDYKNNFPKVICVETIPLIKFKDVLKIDSIKDNVIIEYLKSQGYIVYADTTINTIFIHSSCLL